MSASPASGQPVLTIDLPAITANWRDLAVRGAPGAVAGVVKADGYGLGAAEVARAPCAAGCRHFFVACHRWRHVETHDGRTRVWRGTRVDRDEDDRRRPVLRFPGFRLDLDE